MEMTVVTDYYLIWWNVLIHIVSVRPPNVQHMNISGLLLQWLYGQIVCYNTIYGKLLIAWSTHFFILLW